jgi:mannosyltransferase
MRARSGLVLAALTALAAILRFSTLHVQSFWFDEAVTVRLVRGSFGHMLSSIGGSESTPPLYYALAWVWTRVFGHGEVGLRSRRWRERCSCRLPTRPRGSWPRGGSRS